MSAGCVLLADAREEGAAEKGERERELGSARDRQTPHLQGVHKWFWRQIYQFLLIFNRSIVRKKKFELFAIYRNPITISVCMKRPMADTENTVLPARND